MLKKDGFFQLEKDKEAVEEFLKEVDSKMVKFPSVNDRIAFMIKNNYYYDVNAEYDPDFIDTLHHMIYSYNFKFESFMAVSKFYNDYSLKTDDKQRYLETYEDRAAITSLFLARGDETKAYKWAKALIEQRFQPATPVALNSGKARRGELVSCFLLNVNDDLNSINYNLSAAKHLSKIGGGVSTSLTKLRARKEPIKEIKGAAKGAVPIAKLLELSFWYADQMG